MVTTTLVHTEWPKKMYTLFTHQYLWNELWQCLDADGGHFEHLHWIQNSRHLSYQFYFCI